MKVSLSEKNSNSNSIVCVQVQGSLYIMCHLKLQSSSNGYWLNDFGGDMARDREPLSSPPSLSVLAFFYYLSLSFVSLYVTWQISTPTRTNNLLAGHMNEYGSTPMPPKFQYIPTTINPLSLSLSLSQTNTFQSLCLSLSPLSLCVLYSSSSNWPIISAGQQLDISLFTSSVS